MLNPARRGQREQGGAPNICVFAASTKTSTQGRRWRCRHSATSPAWAFPVAGSMPADRFCSTHTHTENTQTVSSVHSHIQTLTNSLLGPGAAPHGDSDSLSLGGLALVRIPSGWQGLASQNRDNDSKKKKVLAMLHRSKRIAVAILAYGLGPSLHLRLVCSLGIRG